MAKYLDEAGLVELATTIESNFVMRTEYATKAKAGVIKVGGGLEVNTQKALQLSLGTGLALDVSGGLTFSTDPTHLREVANLLKPYIR